MQTGDSGTETVKQKTSFAASLRKCIATCLVAATTVTASGQSLRPDYKKPRPQFPTFVAPYIGREVPEPSFSNSPRIEQLLKDGKIMLSLSDAVALALENNLDLAIARYNLDIADTDILRTKAGSSARGVASGLVQGTPGGGVGGFGSGAPGAGAGGTSGGAGGAGTGTGGIVQSTIGAGAAIESFDPAVISSFNIEHAAFPLANTVTTGTALLRQNSTNGSLGFSQAFPTGTSVQMSMDNTRQTTNSLFSTFVPVLNSSYRFSFRQRLLSGFGTGPNRRFIRIANNNREITEIGFRNQLIATVTQIQNIYWDLVNAVEDVKVKERSYGLAKKTLEDSKKQVELQAIAPIEVERSKSESDNRYQELIVAQSTLELQQLLMKNAVTRDLSDPVLASAPVVPTDTMTVSDTEQVVPTQDLIADALRDRPELQQAQYDLTNREITRKAARNALLPNLDLVSFYGGSGLGGVQNLNTPGGAGTLIPTTGLWDVLGRTFNNTSPDYSIGFSLSIPLRNRSAQADQVRSELEYRQAQLRLKQLQNQIGIEVRNAQFALRQNRARVDAARKARDLSQRAFDIEQKKFQLGASTGLLVLQAGRDFAVASSNLVAATTTYEKSRVELDRAIGATLVRNGISLQDTEAGVVKAQPQIPGLTQRVETPR